jgi:site-specific recombinase XerD
MLSLRKRGKTFHADLMHGAVHAARGSLGTRNQDAARRYLHKIETALSEGGASPLWIELRSLLPEETFSRFARVAGVKEGRFPSWEDLRNAFRVFAQQRVKLGRLAPSTVRRYEHALSEFDAFLAERDIAWLHDISLSLVDDFKFWRMQRILQRRHARDGTGLKLDVAILHSVFAFAVRREVLQKNPVQMEGRPGANPTNGAQPFSGDELIRLRQHANDDMLLFLVLRWTGLRGSDAVALSFGELDHERKELSRMTQKRKKEVIVPMAVELAFALEVEQQKRGAQASDRILLNPSTKKPLSRPRLYQRMLALGRRANVPNVHPHRFRDTFAVDLLHRGASPYDVAKMLGDTIETVERHYMPFVCELRERVRRILENGEGLEELAATSKKHAAAKPN